MKSYLIFVFCLFGIVFNASADDEVAATINLQHQTPSNHSEYYPPTDMPEVYFDSYTEEIIIVADGFSSYYDVDIVSQSTMQLVLYTTISGYGDNIDVSSLPDDNYTIVITSSNNNEDVGQFTNY